MNIFKKRISLILSIVMISLVALPFIFVNAASREVNASYNSKILANKSTTSVTPGSSIVISAAKEDLEELFFSWDWENAKWMTVGKTSPYTLKVPSKFENGSEHHLYVSAKYKCDVCEGTGLKTGSSTETCETCSGKGKVYAATKTYLLIVRDENIQQVSMDVKMGSTTLRPGNTYEVKGGEKIDVSAKTTGANANIALIGYRYSDKTGITDIESNKATITLPVRPAGTKISLYIEAVADNDDGDEAYNENTRTGWKEFILEYVDDTIKDKDINVALNGKNLTEGSTTEANPNESLKITATPTDRVSNLYFKWDNDAWSKVANTGSYATRIPSSFLPGSTHKLYVKAEYDDGEVISEKVYIFKIPATASNITMNVKLDSKTIYSGKSYNVVGKEKVTVTVSASNTTADYIKYRFGNQSEVKVSGAKATITVPTKNVGTRLNLYVQAFGKDGSQTAQNVYTLVYVRNNDGKLDIEPWMEENDELVSLVVNLRNDSEEADKANKNIYALDEVVTYYVDYKNGTGDDITSEVKLVLELPLDFDVVDANGGQVDKNKNTITWVFPDGLEDEEAGTKIVSIKYTSLSKSKYTSERIYPTAGIYRANKEKDRSTVINLIVRDYDEKVKTTHEPYMRGDANKDTFRPNDYITRAEGALVLARIYGLDYMNTRVTDVFSDLDETYVEAQKAIIAASKAGLINGYTNGTFKPNAKMTRAEFIKILACMVEMNADDEEIEGLEIKDVEDCIKVYNDSTRYYIVDGKKVYTHWALEEVTLLARLNMLPLSEDEDEIKLDKEITRAEVAQLVNFYLLRAPASVDSKTKSGFSDVSRRHELFADIIEATREEHEFSMNEDDGTEVAE